MSEISRNARCPCGSGKKYKRCCLPKHQSTKATARPASIPAADNAGGRVMEPDELDQLSNRAIDLIQQGKLDEAESVARELCDRYPDVADGLERLGATWEARGDFARAATSYREAADLIHGADGYDPEVEHYYREQAATLQRKARS